MRLKKYIAENRGLIVILAAFIIAHLYFLFDKRLIIWDEATYMGMGKYLYSAGQSGLFEILRPLALPLLLGIFWKAGLPVFFFGKVLALFFSSGCILLTYSIAKRVFEKKTAVIAAVLLAIMPIFYVYANFLLTEIPSTFFVLLSIWLYINGRKILSPVSACIAMLFRFPQGIMILAFGIVIFMDNFRDIRKMLKEGIVFFGIYGLAMMPFFIFNYLMYMAEVRVIWHAIFRPFIYAFNAIELEKTGLYRQDYFFFFRKILSNEILLAFFAVFFLFYFTKKLYKNPKINLLVITLLSYLLYYTRLVHKEERYAIVFLPFIILLAAPAIVYTLSWLKSNLKFKFAVGLVVLLSGYAVWQDISYFSWYNEKSQIKADFYDAIESYNFSGEILTTDPLVTVFTDQKVTPVYFSLDDLLNALKSNYTAVIYTPRSFVCSVNSCDKNDLVMAQIESRYNLVLNVTYNGSPYYFFIAN